MKRSLIVILLMSGMAQASWPSASIKPTNTQFLDVQQQTNSHPRQAPQIAQQQSNKPVLPQKFMPASFKAPNIVQGISQPVGNGLVRYIPVYVPVLTAVYYPIYIPRYIPITF